MEMESQKTPTEETTEAQPQVETKQDQQPGPTDEEIVKSSLYNAAKHLLDASKLLYPINKIIGDTVLGMCNSIVWELERQTNAAPTLSEGEYQELESTINEIRESLKK